MAWILSVPELEILLALRREAYQSRIDQDLRDGPGDLEAETAYFEKCSQLATEKAVNEIDVRQELERRQAGYYHEAEGRSGFAPEWR